MLIEIPNDFRSSFPLRIAIRCALAEEIRYFSLSISDLLTLNLKQPEGNKPIVDVIRSIDQYVLQHEPWKASHWHAIELLKPERYDLYQIIQNAITAYLIRYAENFYAEDLYKPYSRAFPKQPAIYKLLYEIPILLSGLNNQQITAVLTQPTLGVESLFLSYLANCSWEQLNDILDITDRLDEQQRAAVYNLKHASAIAIFKNRLRQMLEFYKPAAGKLMLNFAKYSPTNRLLGLNNDSNMVLLVASMLPEQLPNVFALLDAAQQQELLSWDLGHFLWYALESRQPEATRFVLDTMIARVGAEKTRQVILATPTLLAQALVHQPGMIDMLLATLSNAEKVAMLLRCRNTNLLITYCCYPENLTAFPSWSSLLYLNKLIGLLSNAERLEWLNMGSSLTPDNCLLTWMNSNCKVLQQGTQIILFYVAGLAPQQQADYLAQRTAADGKTALMLAMEKIDMFKHNLSDFAQIIRNLEPTQQAQVLNPLHDRLYSQAAIGHLQYAMGDLLSAHQIICNPQPQQSPPIQSSGETSNPNRWFKRVTTQEEDPQPSPDDVDLENPERVIDL